MYTIYRKRALAIVGGIWTLAALVATPTFVDYAVYLVPVTSDGHGGHDGNTSEMTSQLSCMPKSHVFDSVNAVIILCASYVIPQAIIFSRYYRLVAFIVRQGAQSGGVLTSSFVSSNRKRIVKMLIIIAVLFSIAWLPYFVLLVEAVSVLYSSCYPCRQE